MLRSNFLSKNSQPNLLQKISFTYPTDKNSGVESRDGRR